MNKYGFKTPSIKEEDHKFGSTTKIPNEVLQEDGQWDNLLPEREIQNRNGFETYNCSAYGTLNAIEAIMLKKFALTVNYSDRAVGINAGTTEEGNDPNTVAQSIREKGLLKEESLPFDNTVKNITEFYSPSPLPENLRQECLLWTDRYDMRHDWLDKKDIKECLKYSPLGVAVYAWVKNSKGLYYKPKGQEDCHWVCLYGFDDEKQAWKIFDSYDNTKKLYTYDSGLTYIKRYYIREKTTEEQLQSKQMSLIKILKQYVKYLKQFISSTVKTTGEIISAVFSDNN